MLWYASGAFEIFYRIRKTFEEMKFTYLIVDFAALVLASTDRGKDAAVPAGIREVEEQRVGVRAEGTQRLHGESLEILDRGLVGVPLFQQQGISAASCVCLDRRHGIAR